MTTTAFIGKARADDEASSMSSIPWRKSSGTASPASLPVALRKTAKSVRAVFSSACSRSRSVSAKSHRHTSGKEELRELGARGSFDGSLFRSDALHFCCPCRRSCSNCRAFDDDDDNDATPSTQRPRLTRVPRSSFPTSSSPFLFLCRTQLLLLLLTSDDDDTVFPFSTPFTLFPRAHARLLCLFRHLTTISSHTHSHTPSLPLSLCSSSFVVLR